MADMHTGVNAARIGVIAETYARALFHLAERSGELDGVLEELREVVELTRQYPKLGLLFEHKTIEAERRGASIREMFGERVRDLTLRFLLVLNDRGRLDELPAIAAAYDRMLKQRRGQVDAAVYTARPLAGPQAEAIGRRLSKVIGREAIVHPHTDPSLVGGLRVRYEDRLIDASVAAQLRRLRRRIADRGQEVLRDRASSMLGESGN